MLEIKEQLAAPAPAQATLTLSFELRQKSRLRTTLDDGTEVGLFLPRGTILRQGDCLRTTNGLVIEVLAQQEAVSTVYAAESTQLLRAAYHLGNRHIALQINPNSLRYAQDHVLDDMVRGLGLDVIHEEAPFEPEPGAYGGRHHHH